MPKTKHKTDANGKPDRAKAILDSATELLGQRGYDGVSARDIAEAAGVNKALVFYYYGSKAELFERVLAHYYDAHGVALESSLVGGGSALERVHRLVDAYLDFIEQNRNYPRLVQQQLAAGGPHRAVVQTHLAAFFSRTVALMGDVTPELGPLAARHFYLTLSGMVTGYFTYAPALEAVWGTDPMSPEALSERRAHVHWIVDTIINGLETSRHEAAHNKEVP